MFSAWTLTMLISVIVVRLQKHRISISDAWLQMDLKKQLIAFTFIFMILSSCVQSAKHCHCQIPGVRARKHAFQTIWCCQVQGDRYSDLDTKCSGSGINFWGPVYFDNRSFTACCAGWGLPAFCWWSMRTSSITASINRGSFSHYPSWTTNYARYS